MSEIYLDNAATTPMTPEVIAEVTKQMQESWGNASTGYSYGRHAKLVMEDSRHILAQSINADDNEIIFTSGGLKVIILLLSKLLLNDRILVSILLQLPLSMRQS